MSKTWRKVKTLQETVTADEETALKKILFVGTGIPYAETDAFAYTVSIKRADIEVSANCKTVYSTVSGAVEVATNGSDYVLTEDDVVTVIGTYL